MKIKLFQILLITLLSFSNKVFSQGLQFYGNEKDFADRSSLCVFNEGNKPGPTQKLTISFEYAAQNLQSPGYIFYLKDFKSNSAYNLSYEYKNSLGCFMFAHEGKKIYTVLHYPFKEIYRKWLPISIHLNFKDNQAKITIGTQKIKLNDIGSTGMQFTPKLFFGMYEHILETASYHIRNLTIQTDKETWKFPLNESQGNDVHDSKGNVTGHISNPVWLINSSYHWKPLFQYYSNTPAGFIFAPDQQRFYIYNHDSIVDYDIYHQVSEKLPYVTQFPIRLGMNFYKGDNIAYVYELNNDKTFIAQMNLTNQTWQTINKDSISLQLHHHCGVYDSIRNRFVFFGGYGNRKYSNTFFCYDIEHPQWYELKYHGDTITPRFFTGIATTKDNKYIYIYGGKGNETGDQNAGIVYYYDLYRLDTSNQTLKKLWELEAPSINTIPTRDMILSKDEKHLYLLEYPEYKAKTHAQLVRLSIANGEYQTLGDSIPLTSEEIATNADLYFNSELNEFYCVIQEFAKHGETLTRVYSLSNPPATLADVKYYYSDKQTHTPILLLAGSITILGICLFFYKKKRTSEKRTNTAAPVCPEESCTSATREEEKEEPTFSTESFRIQKNGIQLFGPFTVISRNGWDITYMFSPKIKNLFLFILINSTKQEGVLSSDLNHLFWPDKPDDKIKNLKNVTMNHLRKVLQELDGIELTHQKGYFKVTVHEECYCDFFKFHQLVEKINANGCTQELCAELCNLLVHGKFLMAIDSPLFDYSKQQTEDFIIPLLSTQIRICHKNKKYADVLHLCTILSQLNPLSETAMTYTVSIYKQQGNLNKALQCYAGFIKEYHNLQGEDYPTTFEQIGVAQ